MDEDQLVSELAAQKASLIITLALLLDFQVEEEGREILAERIGDLAKQFMPEHVSESAHELASNKAHSILTLASRQRTRSS